MRGYRNFILTILYFALCAWYAHIAGAEHIADLTGPLSGIGVAVVGIIGARAANKYAETRRTGESE